MMKTTTLMPLEVLENGTVQVRLLLQDDDGVALKRAWHRTSLPPETPVDLQMAAVNAHLADMGWPSISAADIETIKAACVEDWTPEIITAYRAIMADC